MNKAIILLLITALLIVPGLTAGQQPPAFVPWSITLSSPLYYVGEKADVVVTGPANSFFYMNILNSTSGALMNTYSDTTGPDSNSTVRLEWYEGIFTTGTYVLNVTYLDQQVARISVDVVYDELKLLTIKYAALAQEVQNGQVHDNWQDAEDEERDERIWIDSVVSFVSGIICAVSVQMVLLFIIIPRIRWHQLQAKNASSAVTAAGRKSSMDILAVNGVKHPALEDSEYMQAVQRLKNMGRPPEVIDTDIRDATSEHGPAITFTPWASVGPFSVWIRKHRPSKDDGAWPAGEVGGESAGGEPNEG